MAYNLCSKCTFVLGGLLLWLINEILRRGEWTLVDELWIWQIIDYRRDARVGSQKEWSGERRDKYREKEEEEIRKEGGGRGQKDKQVFRSMVVSHPSHSVEFLTQELGRHLPPSRGGSTQRTTPDQTAIVIMKSKAVPHCWPPCASSRLLSGTKNKTMSGCNSCNVSNNDMVLRCVPKKIQVGACGLRPDTFGNPVT